MSDNSLLVVMGATQEYGTMGLYRSQLEAAGIEYRVEDCSDKPNINGGGNLGYRVSKFREVAQKFSHYEKIVISDAFDVTFFVSKQEIILKIPTAHLLHAAEKNCYPDECRSMPIPDVGLHRYANGGLVAGTPEKFIEWCDAVVQHPRYDATRLDQWFLNMLVSEGSDLCVIDWRTELFFCLYNGYPELEFKNGMPVNTTYSTHPAFLHACGKWDTSEMFVKWERSLL